MINKCLVLLSLMLSTTASAGSWRELGQLPNGNTLSVLDTQFRKGDVITTRVRNDLQTPKTTPNGEISRIETDLQINCKKKSISPIRTMLFDSDGEAETSVNMKGGKEFIKKEANSSMGFAIELFCQDEMAARLKADERKG
jgi:hypothetical protein